MTDDPKLVLGDYLPFLVNRLGPRVEAGFADPLAAVGVSLPEWRVMAVLLDEGPQRLKQLADAISTPLSSTSRLIADMVDSGHLTRARSDDDGRAIRVELTASGNDVAMSVARQAALYQAHMTRNLDNDEVAMLKHLLQRLHDDLDDADALWRIATKETA